MNTIQCSEICHDWYQNKTQNNIDCEFLSRFKDILKLTICFMFTQIQSHTYLLAASDLPFASLLYYIHKAIT